MAGLMPGAVSKLDYLTSSSLSSENRQQSLRV